MSAEEGLVDDDDAPLPWPARAPSPEVCRELFIDDFTARVLIDEAGTILHANPTAAEIIGRTPEEVVGTSIIDYADPGELDSALAALSEMGEPELRTGGIPTVFATQHADGHVVRVELGARDYLDAGGRGMISLRLRTFDREHHLAVFLERLAVGADLDTLLDTVMGHADHLLVDTAPALLLDDGRWVSHEVPEALVRAAEQAPAGSCPWHASSRGERRVVSVDGLPDDLAREARRAGFASCWAEPVVVRNDRSPAASLVMWRVWDGEPFLGAQQAVERLTSTISLAFLHQRARERLEVAASTDHLTGLTNRAEMFAALERSLQAGAVGLLYVDLDRFKEVNDSHGHGVGDRVLVTVADRLRSALRAGDVATRIGGDEFVVLCPGVADDAMTDVAGRLVSALAEPVVVGGHALDLGVSVGAAWSARSEMSADELLEVADRALYRAKRAGGDRWHHADGSGPP